MHYQSFKGTAKEWLDAGVKINGKAINQPGLSLLAQYGVAKVVGEVPRPEGKKGHNEKIYQIIGKSGLKVEFNSAMIQAQEIETTETV
jgi:hypothetical protein